MEVGRWDWTHILSVRPTQAHAGTTRTSLSGCPFVLTSMWTWKPRDRQRVNGVRVRATTKLRTMHTSVYLEVMARRQRRMHWDMGPTTRGRGCVCGHPPYPGLGLGLMVLNTPLILRGPDANVQRLWENRRMFEEVHGASYVGTEVAKKGRDFCMITGPAHTCMPPMVICGVATVPGYKSRLGGRGGATGRAGRRTILKRVRGLEKRGRGVRITERSDLHDRMRRPRQHLTSTRGGRRKERQEAVTGCTNQK